MKLRYVLKFVPALLWMSLIFYLSSRSTAGVAYTGIERFLLFKTLHIVEYAVLAVLIYYPLRDYSTTILYSYLYAISDEIHQSFTPGRGPKISDTFFDLFGIVVAVAFIYLAKKYLKKTKNKLH